MKYLTPDRTDAESVLARREEAWEMQLGFVPRAKFDIVCPVCHSEDVQLGAIKWTTHHIQQPEDRVTLPHRCAIRYKCRRCSFELHFGLPITKQTYDRANEHGWAEKEIRWWRIAELVKNE